MKTSVPVSAIGSVGGLVFYYILCFMEVLCSAKEVFYRNGRTEIMLKNKLYCVMLILRSDKSHRGYEKWL